MLYRAALALALLVPAATIPALAETVLTWSDGRRRVLVTHDEQSALTADRLTRLRHALTVDGLAPLAGLVMVDSRDDPRVQVADLIAGMTRRFAGLGAASPLSDADISEAASEESS